MKLLSKRFGALLMVLVMVMTLLPTSAMAVTGPTVSLDTTTLTDGKPIDINAFPSQNVNYLSGELAVGTEFYVPVMLSADMALFNAFNLQFECGDALEYIGSARVFKYNYANQMEVPLLSTMTSGVGEFVDNPSSSIVAWATSSGVENNGTMPMLYAGFRVVAESATGEEEIVVKSSSVDAQGNPATGVSMSGVALTDDAINYVGGTVSVVKATTPDPEEPPVVPETKTFTVTYKDVNGDVLDTETVEEGNAPVGIVMEDTNLWAYIGWSLTEGGEVVDLASLTVTEAITLYAVGEAKMPEINGDVADPEHSVDTEAGEVTVENADRLGAVESLTVAHPVVGVLQFLQDALESIAAKVGNAATVIFSMENKTVTTEQAAEGEVKRVSLNVKDEQGNKIDFRGAVEVSIPFTPSSPEKAQYYNVYHVNGTRFERMDTTIEGNETNGFVAKFTAEHFSDYAVIDMPTYTMTVDFDKAFYSAGDTATATVSLSADRDTVVGGFQFALELEGTGAGALTLSALTPNADLAAAPAVEKNGLAMVFNVDNGTGFAVGASPVVLATATFTVDSDVKNETQVSASIVDESEVVRLVDNMGSNISTAGSAAVNLYNRFEINKPEEVTFVSGVDAVTEDAGTTYYFDKDTDITFTVAEPEMKILDSVTYKVGEGNAQTLTATDGVYTIPTAEIAGSITLEINYTSVYTVTFLGGTNATIDGDDDNTVVAYAKYNTADFFSDADCTVPFDLPTYTAAAGYRETDPLSWSDGETVWKETQLEDGGYTVVSDVTLTAQVVQIWTVTFDANGGTLPSGQAATVIVDAGTALPTPADAIPAAGYKFVQWNVTTTADGQAFAGTTVTADLTFTAVYEHATYTLSFPAVSGIVWTVNGETVSGTTAEITHGTDVEITMDASALADDLLIKAVLLDGEDVERDEVDGILDLTFTIDGDDITDNMVITLDSAETVTVTLVKGNYPDAITFTSSSVTYKKGATLNAADFGIQYAPGYEAGDNAEFDDAVNEPVDADAEYTINAAKKALTLTYPSGEEIDVEVDTDVIVDVTETEGTGTIVLGVTYKVGDGTPVELTPNANGQYVIPGSQIIDDITVEFEELVAEWEFVTQDQYKALENGSETKIAILKTDKLADGSIYVIDAGNMFWSEKYSGYVYIVSTSETAATLSAQLNVATGAVVELDYSGDLNGDGVVTVADSAPINAALHSVTGLTYNLTYQMRLEMDVDSNAKEVTSSDIKFVLVAALEEMTGN